MGRKLSEYCIRREALWHLFMIAPQLRILAGAGQTMRIISLSGSCWHRRNRQPCHSQEGNASKRACLLTMPETGFLLSVTGWAGIKTGKRQAFWWPMHCAGLPVRTRERRFGKDGISLHTYRNFRIWSARQTGKCCPAKKGKMKQKEWALRLAG